MAASVDAQWGLHAALAALLPAPENRMGSTARFAACTRPCPVSPRATSNEQRATLKPKRFHSYCIKTVSRHTSTEKGGGHCIPIRLSKTQLTLPDRRLPAQAVPPTVMPSMRSVGWPTPTGTLWPSLPQVPTPESSAMSLPIMEMRLSTSGPLPTSVAPLTGY